MAVPTFTSGGPATAPTSVEKSSPTLHHRLSETRGWPDTAEPEPIAPVRKARLTRQQGSSHMPEIAKLLAKRLASTYA